MITWLTCINSVGSSASATKHFRVLDAVADILLSQKDPGRDLAFSRFVYVELVRDERNLSVPVLDKKLEMDKKSEVEKKLEGAYNDFWRQYYARWAELAASQPNLTAWRGPFQRVRFGEAQRQMQEVCRQERLRG